MESFIMAVKVFAHGNAKSFEFHLQIWGKGETKTGTVHRLAECFNGAALIIIGSYFFRVADFGE
ncbi:hypothetical protein D3C78_1859720 [compost metagenome]